VIQVYSERKKAIKTDLNHEGRIIKSDIKKRYTLGIVYEPGVVDSQGDFAEPPEIEKACHNFMLGIQGHGQVNKVAMQLLDSIVKSLDNKEGIQVDVTDILDNIQKGNGLGYMHCNWDGGIGDIVENYITPCDFDIGDQHILKGTWLMGMIWSPEYFAKVESGEITGLSMGGTGIRIPVEGGDN